MSEIIIDKEFQHLLPPLDEKTFSDLELGILEFGVIYPLTLWNGILIDGYNRYMICRKHNIPFETISLEFESKEHVKLWIIRNQTGRRNLNPFQQSYYRGLHYNLDKQVQGKYSRTPQDKKGQTDLFKTPTASRLADEYNVSAKTITRDAKLAEGITVIGEKSPEAKEKVLAGQGRISRTQLQELSSRSDEHINETIEKILDGTHEPRRQKPAAQSDVFADEASLPSQNIHDAQSTSQFQLPQSQQAHHAENHRYEQLSMDGFITKIADDVTNGIRTITHGDNVKSKEALRTLISQLEVLYHNM